VIIDKYILIKKPNGISYKYYKDLGYDLSIDEILVSIEHLSKSSSRLVKVKCDYCSIEKEIKFIDYNKITKKGKIKYACCNCSRIKYKETCLVKHGVDNYFKTEEFKEKLKQYNLDTYGVEYHTQSSIIKDKIKSVVNDKYGVDNISMLLDTKEKVKKTCVEKYGHWNNS
jgi:hypothetical protein